MSEKLSPGLLACLVIVLVTSFALYSCSSDSDGTSDSTADVSTNSDTDADDTRTLDADTAETDAETDASEIDDVGVEEDANNDEPRVGYEILNIKSPSEIAVWITTDLTPEEFETLELSQGWFKNQPRETESDGGSFARSPDATMDGEFTEEEHFGHLWLHNATVIEVNTPLDSQGLLRLNRVAKYHEVTFNAGRTLWVLISPEGEHYVRISRDAGRTVEQPTLPEGWQLVEHVTEEALTFSLPNPTDNIRGDNEDSFQGPVTGLLNLGN